MDEALGWGIAAGVCYFAYKLVFGSSPRRRQISQASVDQVTTMFPNVSQHAARWELERNGGSVERAVERALREGGLPEPPASYFPPSSDSPPAAAAFPTTPVRAAPTPQTPTSGASASGVRGAPPSLIARMGLQAQVAADAKGKGKATEDGSASAGGWSPKAEERERNLRARKEKLVLEARRKLLEKEARRKAEAGSSAEVDQASSP
ncbi:hypothetical protein BMF94_1828 [Rhodotorula taiwanensis]|uniref:CUE domain-containing protein n=1 Tax=Rhodotorula taiwanensis TaxID=741276 RepID=A0A2S5BEI9_9BASI|nr:hypothetical protein BMF94_1828 [Rhodotorula taiwanensis]